MWYSLKPLHRDIPSLADLLEVSPENLQKLFVKGGLGKLGLADKSFSFQASQFDSFRAVFMIKENCEVTRCKIKGMKTKQWFVRPGSQYYGNLCDPGTKGRAPRVHSIQAKRRDFQDAITKLPSTLRQGAEPVEVEEETKEGRR
jgi:hypothetical protein